jgi:hypothetical protein
LSFVTFLLTVIIDLVDLEGQVKNLSGRSKEYANEVVNGRETYILIRVESKYVNRRGSYMVIGVSKLRY